ncbi:MAG: VCBS repeat-containing protein, partial [Chitinophagaceae bacterium]|nr:VCBS repeat-containing protein [Chitinophagaceae bacterium]
DEVLKHIPVTPVANKTYQNKGNLQFEDVGEKWGLNQLTFSNGAAYGDLDNDGDLDLVINNENQPSFIYRNNSAQLKDNHFIGVQLKGDSNNLFAIGSKIKVYAKEKFFYRELIPSRGFQSSVDYKQIIGTGAMEKIDSVIIQWPDLSYSSYYNLKSDSVYSFNKQGAHPPPLEKACLPVGRGEVSPQAKRGISAFFDSVSQSFQKHIEDDYIDFYFERNIPAMLSREGPKAAVADINNDGTDDVYIGGTKDHPGQIYLQEADGEFRKDDQKLFYQFASFEDGACLFFDADGDGDKDLFIAPGGNVEPEFAREMQCRLLINDGKGKFSIGAKAFPATGINSSSAISFDFDNDGDPDLFVGGRSVSRNYGADPRSFIFVNDGKGVFSDLGKTAPSAIDNIGMVTGAAWEDITGDKNKELIIVGEWMAPRIFSYNGKQFMEIKSDLNDMKGWWQSVAVADLDHDGRNDLVLGNIGENFYLNPDKEHPVKLWMNDFDGSGDIDKVLTRRVDGADKPVFLKNDIQDQVPGIKKENLKNHDFALKSIHEIFSTETVNKARIKEFNFSSSVVALNKGNGNFTIKKLPFRGQLSSVNVIKLLDINNDGALDIITGGNRSGFPPQLEKLDASYGDVFINRDNGNFEWQGFNKTNLKIYGEVRDIVELDSKKDRYLLFLRNNDYPKMYRINKLK